MSKLMGGKINVSSTEGVGSSFEFVLPYRRSKLPVVKEKVKQKRAEYEQFSGQLLLAEDLPPIQKMVSRLLERMGITVTIANNGQEAVELAMAQSFDLVLMDMQMPVMDGIEAARTLRAKGNQTPVVPLTANVMEKHRQQFKEVGCETFLTKPINKKMLMTVLQRHLNKAET